MEVLPLLLVFFSLVLPLFTDPIFASSSPPRASSPTPREPQDETNPNSLNALVSTQPTSHDGTLTHTLALNLHLSRSIPSSQLRVVRSLVCFGIGEDVESDTSVDFVGGDDGLLVTGVWIDGEAVLGLQKDFEDDELELELDNVPWNASLIADAIGRRERTIRTERVKKKRKRRSKSKKGEKPLGDPTQDSEPTEEDDGKLLQFWFVHSDPDTGKRRIVVAYPTVKKFPVQKDVRITYERKYATKELPIMPVSVSSSSSVFQVFWTIADVPIALESLNVIFELPEDAIVVDGAQDRWYASIVRGSRLAAGDSWRVIRRYFSGQMRMTLVEGVWVEKFRLGEKIEVYAFCGVCAAATVQMIVVVVFLKGGPKLKLKFWQKDADSDVPRIVRDWPLDGDEETRDLTMFDIAFLLSSKTGVGVLATLLDLLGRHQLVILRSKVFGLLGKPKGWPRLGLDVDSDQSDVRERDRIVVESICGGEMVFDVALVSILDSRLADRRAEKALLEKGLIQIQSVARYAWVIAAVLPIFASWRFYSMMTRSSDLIVLSFAAVRFGHCTLLLFVSGILLLLITLSMISSRKLTPKGKILVSRLDAYRAHLREVIQASGVTGVLSPRMVLLNLLDEWKRKDTGEERNMLKNAHYVDALQRRMKGKDVSFEVPDPDEARGVDSESEEEGESESEFDD